MANEAKKDSQENLVMVDANTLAATIAAAVAQAMANQQNNHEAMGSVIGAAVAKGIAENTRKKVSFGEYEAKRKASRSALTRRFWQNGIEVNPDPLTNDEIDLLNRLTHSGRYFDRLVEFGVTADDIYMTYNNKTADQRFELKNHFRGLLDCLQQVVKQQEQEDRELRELEDEKRAEKAKREEAKQKFASFSGKATREARERAAEA